MSNFILKVTHGGVLVIDLDTDDVDEVTKALDGFEYELSEMLSGQADER
jgi:hypothetical protein